MPQTTSVCTRTMDNNQTTNNLVKIKYLFTANQMHNSKKQMILTTLLTGNKPQPCHPRHRQTTTAIRTSISLRMTTPRCCSRFQHFIKLRAPIRRHQMPYQAINSFNSNHFNCLKFTLHMHLLTAITITIHTTIAITTTTITTTIITAALMEPMNLVISRVRPLELPKRKGLSTKRSDLNSTKKSRK